LRSELSSSGSLDWGDGWIETFKIGNYTFKHVYHRAGDYAIHVNLWGAYKWNSNEGSCSYECETDVKNNSDQIRHILLTVDPAVPGQVDTETKFLAKFPGKCAVYQDTKVKCVVVDINSHSGVAGKWGDWYSISSGVAPAGYKLEYTEFQGKAPVQPGGEVHRCGASNLAHEPEPGVPIHGKSYWFQCILKEFDESHAVWTYSIQGTEAAAARPSGVVRGTAELTSIFVSSSP
jgi:hypothetical protein